MGRDQWERARRHTYQQPDQQTNPGVHGRWFKRDLDPRLWAEVEKTFAGAGIEENWRAMYATAAVFGRIAAEVGERLGYAYAHELDRTMTRYLQEIRAMGGPGS